MSDPFGDSRDPLVKSMDRANRDAEIARLQEEVNYLKIADNHHQELMAEKEEEIAGLQDWKRKQAEDIMTLGQMIGKVEADRDRLQAHEKALSEFVTQLHQENCSFRAALEPYAEEIIESEDRGETARKALDDE